MARPCPIRDAHTVNLSFGQSSPPTIRKVPCMMPRRCVDNPSRGTVNMGTAETYEKAKEEKQTAYLKQAVPVLTQPLTKV